ncbi:MAG: hypothetical protein ACOZAO_05745 [Patescibacteria group bacterium]
MNTVNCAQTQAILKKIVENPKIATESEKAKAVVHTATCEECATYLLAITKQNDPTKISTILGY